MKKTWLAVVVLLSEADLYTSKGWKCFPCRAPRASGAALVGLPGDVPLLDWRPRDQHRTRISPWLFPVCPASPEHGSRADTGM